MCSQGAGQLARERCEGPGHAQARESPLPVTEGAGWWVAGVFLCKARPWTTTSALVLGPVLTGPGH